MSRSNNCFDFVEDTEGVEAFGPAAIEGKYSANRKSFDCWQGTHIRCPQLNDRTVTCLRYHCQILLRLNFALLVMAPTARARRTLRNPNKKKAGLKSQPRLSALQTLR